MAGMERILFYLPTVTPWWFDTIVVRLIGTLAASAEVHVIVPPLWRNTGIGPEQLRAFASLPPVHWHIADGDDHPSLRTAPAEADADALVALTRSIDPAYVLCRSADVATPARFPGKVRHLMEAGAPPFATRADWIVLQRDFWHHGAMPVLTAEDRRAIDAAFAGTWKRMRGRTARDRAFRASRAEALRSMGLPQDRAIVALPLEYEHEEAMTRFHNRFERNLDLIGFLVERLENDFVLALSDHPLNCRHVDNSRLYETVAALGDRVRLVPNPQARHHLTDLLVRHCDGLIVQNTKAIYSGAFFGKPTLRLSHRPTAEWLQAHGDLDAFKAAALAGARGAAEDRVRLWFGWHLLHEIIDPATVTAAEILDRIERPFSRDRLAAGLARLEAGQRDLAIAA